MTIRELRDLTPQVDTLISVITFADNKEKELYWGRAVNLTKKVLDAEVDYFYPNVSINHKAYLVVVTFKY